jgi:hypothetical protein
MESVYDGGSELEDGISKISNQDGFHYGEIEGKGRFLR